MNKQRNLLSTSLLRAVLLATVVVGLAFQTFSASDSEWLLNSDVLHGPFLLKDVLTGKGNISDWTLPPNALVFPDFLLQAAIHLLGGSVQLGFFLYAVISLTLFLLSIEFAARRAFIQTTTESIFASQLLFLLPFILESTPFHSGTPHFLSILMPLNHGSLAVLGLAIGVLFLGPIFGWFTLLVATLLLSLLIASDRMTYSLFVCPLLGVLIVAYRNILAPHRRLTALLVSSLLGELLLKAISSFILPTDVPTIAGSFSERMQNAAFSLLIDLSNQSLLLSIAIITGLACLGLTVWAQRNHASPLSRRLSLFTLLAFSSAILTPVVLGLYLPGAHRYVLPGILLGWATATAFFAAQQQNSRRVFLLVSAGSVLLSTFSLAVAPQPGLVWKYQTALSKCIDNYTRVLKTRVGFSDYWASKSGVLGTKRPTMLLPLTSRLTPEPFAINQKWFSQFSGKASFIVVDRLNRETLLATFGPPRREYHCSGGTFWAYDRLLSLPNSSDLLERR